MAMRKDEIPDNKFTLPLEARDLALYTRQITKNAKIFDPEIDAHLPGQLRATADQIYFDIFEACWLRWTWQKSVSTSPASGVFSGAIMCEISGSAAGTGTKVMQSGINRFDIQNGCRLLGRNVRLRSANRGNGNNAFNVNSSGNVNNWNGINANRSAPDWTAASPQKPLHSRGRAKTAVQGAECHACPLAGEQ